MTDEQRELLLQHLETLDPQTFSSKERAALCDCLRQETARHQDFPEADWARPGEYVQRLDACRTRFEPDDLVDRYCWLFSYRMALPGMLHRSCEARKCCQKPTHGSFAGNS
jgi:hypothetical protein